MWRTRDAAIAMTALAAAACGSRSSSKPPPETASAAPANHAAVAKRWPGPCSIVERRDGKPEPPVVFQYDDAGRMAGWSYDDEDFGLSVATLKYDTAGRLVEDRRVDKLSVDIWRYTYDANGHPIAVGYQIITPDEPIHSELGPEVDEAIEKWRAHSEPEKQVWSGEWDAAGNLALEYLGQSVVSADVTVRLEGDDTATQQPAQAPVKAGPTGERVSTARYTYDASGRVLTRDYDDTRGGGSFIKYTYGSGGACQPLPRNVVTMQGGEWQVLPLVDDRCPTASRRTSRDGKTLQSEGTQTYDDAGNLVREEELQYDLDNLKTGAVYSYDGAGNITAKFWLREGGAVEPFATYDYSCWTN